MNEEFSEAMYKILGPFVLFVGTPFFIWVLYFITKQNIEAGTPLEIKNFIFFGILIISSVGLGVYSCNRAFGWFTKK